MLTNKAEVKNMKNNENGIFAKELIKEGEVVWKLDKNERSLSKEERDGLPERIRKYAYQYGDHYIVVRDDSKFMNHSCDPNTWWYGDDKLIARRNIRKGEEITYDYSTADVGDWKAKWKCNCSSDICREYISGIDTLDVDLQKRYKGHLPSWVQSFISLKKDENRN